MCGGLRLPLMTEEQLRLNLPYEFHDYIGDEMDKYVFDYAMIRTKERTWIFLVRRARRRCRSSLKSWQRWRA